MINWASLTAIVSIASTFGFLSVFYWALQRRREREAYYRYEGLRRLMERSDAAPEMIGTMMRDADELENRRRRDGLLLAAFVFLGIGAGILIAVHRHPFASEGIPGWGSLGTGTAMFLHLLFTRKRPVS
ncbi:MAG TPA: hypothetical protein VKB93_16090 [Thermoanaerobaculia bacterium]|nr:hypothetical protein [Thermoanaerobaculia bacterium]